MTTELKKPVPTRGDMHKNQPIAWLIKDQKKIKRVNCCQHK